MKNCLFGLLFGIYLFGAATQVAFTIEFEGNSTLGLAALRIAVWPVYWTTGWPRGVPQRMD